MKFNYQFSNLLGTVYRSGNLIFTPDGNSVISPVGNKISGKFTSTLSSREFISNRFLGWLCLLLTLEHRTQRYW